MTQISLDTSQKEKVEYITDSLPISYCNDDYDSLINNEVPFHWHSEFELLIVTKGEIDCVAIHKSGVKVTKHIKEGDGAFFNSKVLHYMHSDIPDTHSRTFSFSKDFFTFQSSGTIYRNIIMPLADSPIPLVALTSDNIYGRSLLSKIRELYAVDVKDQCWELYCIETICCAWRNLLKLFSHAEKNTVIPQKDEIRENRLWTMVSYIQDNYSKDITIADICESANISKSECFRCFESVINQTPIDYLNDYRLSRAASLLMETNKSITLIANECGFNSSSYFGSVFRKKFNVSPGQYRTKFETSKFHI